MILDKLMSNNDAIVCIIYTNINWIQRKMNAKLESVSKIKLQGTITGARMT